MAVDKIEFICEAERGFAEDYALRFGEAFSYQYDLKPKLDEFFSQPLKERLSFEQLVRSWYAFCPSDDSSSFVSEDVNPIAEGFRSDFLFKFFPLHTPHRDLQFNQTIAPFTPDQLYWAAVQSYCGQMAPRVWEDRQSFFNGWLLWISDQIAIYSNFTSSTHKSYEALYHELFPQAPKDFFTTVFSLYVKYCWETVGYFLPSPLYNNFRFWLDKNKQQLVSLSD